jgi:hypothetical protein
VIGWGGKRKMLVEILRFPTDTDWLRCKKLALGTVGKNTDIPPTDEWKENILKSEHSPIRTLMFTIKMQIPYYVSVHLVRHKHGVEHYVKSQRNDRQKDYDRCAARQDEMVTHIMDINAQALISMSHMRLCVQADLKTRQVMELIKRGVVKVCPYLKDLLVPKCVYRGGLCDEFKSCGYNRKVFIDLFATQVFGMDKYDVSNLLDIAQGAYYDIAER